MTTQVAQRPTRRPPHDPQLPLATLSPGAGKSLRLIFNRAAACTGLFTGWDFAQIAFHRRSRYLILHRVDERAHDTRRIGWNTHGQGCLAVTFVFEAHNLRRYYGRLSMLRLSEDAVAVGPLPREPRAQN